MMIKEVARMTIGILKKGDSVLNVTPEFIAVQRKNGEVDIVPLLKDETGLGELTRVFYRQFYTELKYFSV